MSLTKATYSMISGAPVNVFDFMTAAQIADVQAGTLSLDVTVAVVNAISAAKAQAGKVVFPAGSYSVEADSISLSGTAGLDMVGNHLGFVDNHPVFVARTAGDYLIELSSQTEDTYNVNLSNLTFDGNALVTNVLKINAKVGGEVTYCSVKKCNFLNVKPSGSLVSNETASAVFAESAIWYFEECGFACNGAVGSQGNAIVLNNYGAWGWVFEKCHFDTQTQYAHIRLIAGLITLNNCQFDNSSTSGASTNVGDIQVYSSSGITINGCNSGSANPFLITYAKTTTGKWDNYPIYINNCQGSALYPPTNGIQHSTTNPIYINGYYGSNVLLSGVPIETSAVGSTYLYQTNRDANLFASQKAGASADALTLASNDLTTFLETSIDSTTGVGISAYKPGTGYIPYTVVASNINFNLSSGKLNIANLTQVYANNAAALAGGLVIGDVYRNGDVLQIVH